MDNKEEDLVVKGPPLHAPLNKTSVGIQLYESLARNRDKDLFVQAETNESVTFGDYFKTTCTLAQALKNAGYQKNDVVSICSENSPRFFQPVVASLYLGITISPINHTYTEHEILHVLNLTKSKAVFCSSEVAHKFTSVMRQCGFLQKIIIIDSDEKVPDDFQRIQTMKDFICSNVADSNEVDNFKPIPLDCEKHMAVILCSSGTTGLPKGVMITHLNICYRLNHCSDPSLHISSGVKLGALPFFHGYGFMMTLGALVLGETVVVLSKFKEELFYSTIEKYEFSELSVAPPILVMMAKSPLAGKCDFSSVKHFISGAAPLGEKIEEELNKRLKISIRQGYGLTEATLAVFLTPPNGVQKRGSSGKIVPGMSCKIRDPKTHRILRHGEIGEICVKGGLVANGYINNPQATAETFQDGWVLTGDLGYYDEDGYFYIVDRLKELIKYKGFQVAPAELEALLLKHEKVKDVGVIGKPDDLAGELPMAFVVKQDGVELNEEDVIDFVKANISYTKWLYGGVRFVGAIPKNPSGKILRRELRNLLLAKSKL